MINNTPDAQRYITHPLLSQYHLSNSERVESKLDLNWQLETDWAVSANFMLRRDDYKETELGLTESEMQHISLNLNWTPSDKLQVSSYASFDQHDSEQTGRSFRGGIEKNAFEIYGPLPQASDPTRNWDVEVGSESVTLGVNVKWQLRHDISVVADYNYLDSSDSYDFVTYGADDIAAGPLSDNEITQHHLTIGGTYALREDLSIKLNYQYWSFDSDDWGIHAVSANTLDKVLTLGQQEADESLHYIGTSVVYRWQ